MTVVTLLCVSSCGVLGAGFSPRWFKHKLHTDLEFDSNTGFQWEKLKEMQLAANTTQSS